jgi:hypothetical protein
MGYVGIFDMPLIYGEEREKAFKRLRIREEIDKASKVSNPYGVKMHSSNVLK